MNLIALPTRFTERGRVTVEVHADAPTADRAVLHLSDKEDSNKADEADVTGEADTTGEAAR